MSTYKKTGFPRGRPRKGELRPRSVHAEAQQRYREAHREHWLEKNREYQAKWRAANLERSNEISRNYERRKRQWREDQRMNALVEKLKELV